MQQCEADREWKRQKQVATRDTYSVANQQRMAARRALEWIGRSKAQLFFLEMTYQPFLLHYITLHYITLQYVAQFLFIPGV